MLFHPRSKDRPFHQGPFPLEALPRDQNVITFEASRPPIAAIPGGPRRPNDVLASAVDHYRDIFSKFVEGVPAQAKAPVPDDLQLRSIDIKGGTYFMDASCAGICRIPKNGWLAGVQIPSHDFAIVVMVERPRLPEAENLAHDWTRSSAQAAADMRACEIACCLAEYIRHMGFKQGSCCRKSTH